MTEMELDAQPAWRIHYAIWAANEKSGQGETTPTPEPEDVPEGLLTDGL